MTQFSTITHDGTWLVMVRTWSWFTSMSMPPSTLFRRYSGLLWCHCPTWNTWGQDVQICLLYHWQSQGKGYSNISKQTVAAVLDRQHLVEGDEGNTFGTVRTSKCEMLITEGNPWLACNSHQDSWRKMLSKPTEAMDTSTAANSHLYLHYINIPKKHQTVTSLKQ